MEFTLLAAVALGGAAAYAMLWWEARHGNADRCAGNIWEAGLVAAIVGLFAGRIAAMVVDGVNPLAHPGDVLVVRGGVSTVVASLAAVLTYLWLGRREPVAMADGISAAALAGLAGWHAGCVFRSGACLGTASDLPWALAQPGSSVTRHPVEIYAALLLLLAALAIAAWKAYGRPPAGVPASAGLLGAAAARFLTEPLRPSLTGGPVWWYAVGVAIGAFGIIAFTVRARRSPQTP